MSDSVTLPLSTDGYCKDRTPLTARTEANMQLNRADACRHLAVHLDDEVGSLLDRARTTARNRTRQPEL